MNTSNSKLLENKSFMELDGLDETGKEFKELTVLELKQFERVK